MRKTLSSILNIAKSSVLFPRLTSTDLQRGRTTRQSAEFFSRFREDGWSSCEQIPAPQANHLREYFDNHRKGKGIWKWDHYFDLYTRHLAKFVGQNLNLVEIGVYSGGSLDMWRHYLGRGCHVYGVDIEEDCLSYESEGISILIGDQESPEFWNYFKQRVGPVDVLIDDGGHTPDQQRVTLNEMLASIRPGGVYICEDIHGSHNPFIDHAAGLVHQMNQMNEATSMNGIEITTNSIQSSVCSITFYPYALVIEKMPSPRDRLFAPMRGTQWQPFFSEQI